MFQALHIRNFALIENITIEFGTGLNILSGETGSGKSIIVQALELLIGGRGSVELIREGEEEAEVTGLFTEIGEEDEVAIRRVLTRQGKHKTYINDRPASLAALEALGQRLIDLASQHEQQSLLQPLHHVKLLDDFSLDPSVLKNYQGAFAQYQAAAQEVATLHLKVAQVRQQEEFMRFQLREIQGANLSAGEEEALSQERARSKNGVRLGQIVTAGEELLDSGEGAILERANLLKKSLEEGAQLDASLASLLTELQEGLCHLEEVAQGLRRYQDQLSCDPERLQEVEDRLALLSQLKRKHGGDLEAVLKRQQELEQSLLLLDDFAGELTQREQLCQQQAQAVITLARQLDEQRRAAGIKLAQAVEKELRQLGVPQGKFEVAWTPLNTGAELAGKFYNESGMMSGEFLLAPNVGEGFRPLAKVASGGELSRILLAIKKVIGQARSVTTYVFDEVDAGIGGRIAEVVGKSLAQLAAKRQVLCVTHLPQVACFGEQHFVISKRTERGRTKTLVARLESREREEEIARMLAGIQVTEQARAHAREMIRIARE